MFIVGHDEHYIQNLLLTLHIDPFHDPARNIINGLELTSKIIDGLLSAKDVGEKLLAEFVKNGVTSRNESFFERIKQSGIVYREDKRKTPKAISVLKEDRQALGLFVAKYTDKKNAFTYPLTTYPLSIADPRGKLYQPKTKHVFRNDFIKLCSNSVEKTPS